MRKAIWWWIGGGVALVCVAAVLLFWWFSRTDTGEVAPIATAVPPAAAPAIQNPVPAQAMAPEALPALDASDPPLHTALTALGGAQGLDALLRPEMLVRHIVVTVDNLPRKRVAVELRPVRAVPGHFGVAGDEQASTLDPANYARYAPYVKLVQQIDLQQFAALYFHFYPLFQQAYQNLGYPSGYFNDRLIVAIDDLLAAPEASGPLALVRPNVMYLYADPKLEDLSAGQKVLLRMGPENAAIVKARLRELRALVMVHSQGTSP
jgi:hypothetical protein